MNSNTHASSGLHRRSFFRTALAGAAAALPNYMHAQTPAAKPAVTTTNSQFHEPDRQLPLNDDADVIVCGGGPAGFAAALTAARAGAKVRLFEVHGCLGGVWTAGLLTYIFDFNKPGLPRELTRKLDERDARRSKVADQFVYEPEAMKLLLEDLCVEAGVKIHLHTRLAAAYREARQLTTVITESKSGREAWRAKVFIDATGDGDLGAFAACAWDVGQGGAECPCQPLTMNAMAMVKDAAAIKEFISFYDTDPANPRANGAGHLKATHAFLAEIKRAGLDPSYGSPTLFQVRDNLIMVMINHEYDIKAFDAPAVTAATIRSRSEVFRVVNALRKLGGVWEGIQVVTTAEQIGIRDGRRIHGRYTVNREDLISGARHADAVTRATFPADIHASDRTTNKHTPISHGDIKFKAYDIPLRALIAKDVDGLLMAGRCISGDFLAHASYRVTGNAVAMGEATGAVAAVAVASKRQPHEIEWVEAAAVLKKVSQDT